MENLFQTSRLAPYIHVLAIFFLGLFFYPFDSNSSLSLVMLGVVVLSLFRAIYHKYLVSNFDTLNLRLHEIGYSLLVFSTALCWGFLPPVLHDSLTDLTVLYLAIAGLSAAGVVTLAARPIMAILFLFGITGPSVVMPVFVDTHITSILAVFITLFDCYLLFALKIVYSSLIGSYTLWFQVEEREKEITSYADALEKSNLSLKAAQDRLQRSLEGKSSFFAKASHEIRTPLGGLSGILQLLNDVDDPEEREELIETAEYCVESLLEIVNEVLDISSIEADQVRVNLEAFDFKNFLAHLVRLYTAAARQKNIKCQVTVDPQVPSCLVSDAQRLRQVLTNLVSNALKFTPRDGKISIRVWLENGDNSEMLLTVSVKDNGIGIAEDRLQKIFQTYQQADETISSNYGGTGLGLAITEKIIEALGGSITVTSETNNGADFTFRIPVQRVENTAAALQIFPGKESQKQEIVEVESLNVLVVDDSETNRKVAKKFLEQAGHRVTVAEDGFEAVALAGEDWDVVIMDLQMPGMSGFEASKKMIELRGEDAFPIIALTAHAAEDTETRIEEAGMTKLILKPIRKTDFVSAVSICAGMRRQQSNL